MGPEGAQAAAAPAADGGGVQGLEHAKIVLTTSDNCRGPHGRIPLAQVGAGTDSPTRPGIM
ncbi:hypothetical protein Ade02nite_07890 [Paractinoplanes deccanensis]|uniref:Uncharacterized protein n=1 Tax=Paractinoplanes deccanensis TaxID=113561 RepID=A0ABQ3XWL2_9ACTN|nr:hypothetical protein Ade02nite_07890 [Actinoplanes deccanensis]